jgi:hypothetical protein
LIRASITLMPSICTFRLPRRAPLKFGPFVPGIVVVRLRTSRDDTGSSSTLRSVTTPLMDDVPYASGLSTSPRTSTTSMVVPT